MREGVQNGGGYEGDQQLPRNERAQDIREENNGLLVIIVQVENLHKKPHLATPEASTLCQVHVLNYIIRHCTAQRGGT